MTNYSQNPFNLQTLIHPDLPRGVKRVWHEGQWWDHYFDVCKVLGFTSPKQAVHYHLLDGGKTQNPGVQKLDSRNSRGELRKSIFLNRQAITELALHSKLAKENANKLNRLLAALIEEKLVEKERQMGLFGPKINKNSPLPLQQKRSEVALLANARTAATKASFNAKGEEPSKWEYVHAARAICKAVTGKGPKELKKELGAPWRDKSTLITGILTTVAETQFMLGYLDGKRYTEIEPALMPSLTEQFAKLRPALEKAPLLGL